jgi:hypothetical protein
MIMIDLHGHLQINESMAQPFLESLFSYEDLGKQNPFPLCVHEQEGFNQGNPSE